MFCGENYLLFRLYVLVIKQTDFTLHALSCKSIQKTFKRILKITARVKFRKHFLKIIIYNTGQRLYL